jgi:hypothetical protein
MPHKLKQEQWKKLRRKKCCGKTEVDEEAWLSTAHLKRKHLRKMKI